MLTDNLIELVTTRPVIASEAKQSSNINAFRDILDCHAVKSAVRNDENSGNFRPGEQLVELDNLTELDKIFLERCIRALHAQGLDSADYILLTTGIIAKKFGAQADDYIKKIHRAFVDYDYNTAISLISKILPSIKDWELHNLLQVKQENISTVDNPEKNQTRRYFETKLAIEMWQSQTVKQFKSIDKLAVLINQKAKYEHPLPEQIATYDLSDTEKYEDALDEASMVIRKIRSYGEEIPGLLLGQLKNTKGGIYLTKDRGDEKQEKIYSFNVGIVKSSSPMPLADRLDNDEDAMENRIPDMFKINETVKDGYSRTHTRVPYVNSLSGSTYSLIAVLVQYAERYKNDFEFESDIVNIINAFTAFTCKNGYHSLAEIYGVLNDRATQECFKINNIKLLSFSETISEQLLSKVIIAGTEYSINVNLQKLINIEIASSDRVATNKK